MLRVELAIVGGGPAGLATALHLLQHDRGWAERMLVLEKAVHPRPKLCGGGITRFGLRQLELLNLTPQVPYIQIEQARFDYGQRRFTVRGQPIFIVTRREEFDAWLAEVARQRGVRLLEDHPVARLETNGGGFRLETPSMRVEARAVVGADGARGMVRRWIGRPEGPSRVARLLEVVHRASGQEFEYRERLARFDFTAMQHELQGYYWDFPSLIGGQPYLNSGVYDSRVDAGGRRADLTALLSDGLGRQPDHLEGHPIHWFAPDNTISAPGALLVGDAAGADPLLGEGIGIALGYGAVAAETIQRAWAQADYGFAHYRRRLLLAPVGRYLMVRWLGAQMLYHLRTHPRLVQTVWRVMQLGAVLLSRSDAWPRPRQAT